MSLWQGAWGFQPFTFEEWAPRDSVLAQETSSFLTTELLERLGFHKSRANPALCGSECRCAGCRSQRRPVCVLCRSDCGQAPCETALLSAAG